MSLSGYRVSPTDKDGALSGRRGPVTRGEKFFVSRNAAYISELLWDWILGFKFRPRAGVPGNM